MLTRALLLIAMGMSPVYAAVVINGNNNNSDWWSDGCKAPCSFGILDEDGDGKVSAAEMGKARQQYALAIKETKSTLIASVDKDHTGKMSRYEASEAMPRWVSLRERARDMAIATYDKNGDGKLTPDESYELERKIATVFLNYGAGRVDANKDNNYSRPEVQAAIAAIKDGKGALFILCDKNNDGQMSVQEAKMATDLLAATAGL